MPSYTLPGGVGVALYGAGVQGSILRAAERIMRVQPQILVIHSSAKGLLEDTEGSDRRSLAARATAIARAIVPDVTVWWEIAGDMPSQIQHWAPACEAAAAAGAAAMVINAERYWKKVPATLADDAVRTLDDVRRDMPVGHSSFGWPCWVEGFGGGHEEYPWAAFIGHHGLDFTLPQVYWGKLDSAPSGYVTEREQGIRAWRASRRSYEMATHKQMARKGIPMGVYLASYSTHRADACRIGVEYPCALFWSADRLEPHGLQSMHALAELHRRGYWRSGGVRAYQESAGLTPDDLIGPITLESLGVPR